MKKNDVIVIGAGIGGMNAALQLAKAGLQVSIFEKNAYPGGRMRRIHHEGCTFDAGPSLITMPFILQDAFSSEPHADTQQFYPELIAIDPICHYRWLDGTTYNCYANADKRNAETARVFGDAAVQEMNAYLNHAADVYHATKDVFLFNRFEGFKEFFKLNNIAMLPKLSRLRFAQTFHDFNAEYFNDPKLIQLFDRFATYNGSSPYLAPATLMVIPFIEFEYGGWYPRGGIYAIAEAFEQACLHQNITIHYNADVKKIIVQDSIAKGIQLESGEIHTAEHIISNGDVYYTRTALLKRQNEKLPPLSSSGFVMMMSVKRNPFAMNHHTVLFSDHYKQEFQQIFHEGSNPEEMTIYISVSGKTDASQISDDCENWFILVNTPSVQNTEYWTSENKQRYADIIMKQLQRFYPDIETYISGQPIYISPSDFAHEFHATGGSLYGSSSNSMFSAFLRPKNRDASIKNIYYCGGSSHPGGGVPLVILSGGFAAQEILDHHKA